MPFMHEYNTPPERASVESCSEAFRLIRQLARLHFWLRDNGIAEDDYEAWANGGSAIERFLREERP